MTRIVLGLGGNALLARDQPADIAAQRANAQRAAAAIAPLADSSEVVITHGNGPQIGSLDILQSGLPSDRRYPLDVLGAETEGLIGYLLEVELRNQLPHRKLATILTMVEIDPADPAFKTPEKPIGPVYAVPDWGRLAQEHGWQGICAAGGMRRVVPSPRPRRILQTGIIQDLLKAQCITICAGGGGVPVQRRRGAGSRVWKP